MARKIKTQSFDRGVRFLNPAQVGGIETSVLDNGPGRLVRIAWVNTGSPLRYKVVIDRGLDIAEACYAQHSLAYLSLTGTTPPSRALDEGLDWLWGFFGGLLCSCGPQHVGAPEADGGARYGLHGTHSNTPAALDIVCQPDPAAGVDTMSLTGTVRTARHFGPNVELTRTIRSVLGQPMIHVHDTFLNRGNTPARHAWLLHINLGWPLLDEGARIIYRGEVTPRPDSTAWFADPRKYRIVPAPVAEHAGAGEAVAFVNPPADEEGNCHVGLVNEKLGLGLEIKYPRENFPRLANWHHFGPGGEYVMGLEPLSGGMGCGVGVGRLEPGQVREYDCTMTVLAEPQALKDFARKWG